MKIEDIVLKYSLLNAKQYGKAREDAVIKKVLAEVPEAKKEIKLLFEVVKKIVSEVNSLSKEEIEKRILELG
ncbi:MAG: glutamate--tRNA ligase, partial [Candidatus Aenigmatarchaeota archaeon]